MARRADAHGAVARSGMHHALPNGARPLRHLRTVVPRRHWPRLVAGAVALVLVGVIAVAGYWAVRLQANLRQAPLSAGTATADARDAAKDRLQILIIGTDTRDGANGAYGTEQDSTGFGNADVMILMDISADNRQISMVSFPRDLVVPIPACTNPQDGERHEAIPLGQLNASMSEGGPGCTLDAINAVTGLSVDHFMIADFNAVKELSNDIGGVEVCVNADIDDPSSGLKLHAGTNSVQGEQALAFLRSRHGVGDGSDLARIKSQQAFLASLARKVRSDGTLTNVPKMLAIADTITKNLTVDHGLANPQTLLTIGNRLKDVDLGKVAFVTVPWEEFPADLARVQLKQPDAEGLFQALREGRDLTAPASPTPSSAPTAPATPAAPSYERAGVPVTVANGSGVPGRAQELLQYLSSDGFLLSSVLSAQPAAATAVYYGAGFEAAAADIAARFGLPVSQVIPSPIVSGVQLYVGQDFGSGERFVVPAPEGIVSQTAAEATCQTAFGY